MISGAEEAVVRHALARGMVSQAAVEAARRDAAVRRVSLLDAQVKPADVAEVRRLLSATAERLRRALGR